MIQYYRQEVEKKDEKRDTKRSCITYEVFAKILKRRSCLVDAIAYFIFGEDKNKQVKEDEPGQRSKYEIFKGDPKLAQYSRTRREFMAKLDRDKKAEGGQPLKDKDKEELWRKEREKEKQKLLMKEKEKYKQKHGPTEMTASEKELFEKNY